MELVLGKGVRFPSLQRQQLLELSADPQLLQAFFQFSRAFAGPVHCFIPSGDWGGIVVDLAGNLFLAGVLDAWAVARRTPDGVWQDIEYPLGGPEANWVPSSADVMTIDALGNWFVVGEVRSGMPGDSTSSLVIQKLAATVLPPLAVKLSGNSVIVGWPAALSGAQLESTNTLNPGAAWVSSGRRPETTRNGLDFGLGFALLTAACEITDESPNAKHPVREHRTRGQPTARAPLADHLPLGHARWKSV